MLSSEIKVWFITGCSSGFGRAITKYALQKGDKVAATLRKPEVLSELETQFPERLLVLGLDVTRPAEVTTAFVASLVKFGRIDVVVNNAGFGVVAEAEGMAAECARSMFEVNFWGASHVTKEAVKIFRDVNQPMGGRLLQVSSLAGVQSATGGVYYSASKFALEALSEGLAAELHPDWNIKITILEPGQFLTEALTDNLTIKPAHSAYTDPSLPTLQLRAILANPDPTLMGDPAKFAEAVYKAAYLADPPLRLPIHPVSLVTLREKGKHLLETADKWESWSEGVLLNGQTQKLKGRLEPQPEADAQLPRRAARM